MGRNSGWVPDGQICLFDPTRRSHDCVRFNPSDKNPNPTNPLGQKGYVQPCPNLGLDARARVQPNPTVTLGRTMLLSGWADYVIGHQQTGWGSSNLIIVEVKRRYAIGNVYGQLLAYMGLTLLWHYICTWLIFKDKDDSQSMHEGKQGQRYYFRSRYGRVYVPFLASWYLIFVLFIECIQSKDYDTI
jgi:hypothetical protein